MSVESHRLSIEDCQIWDILDVMVVPIVLYSFEMWLLNAKERRREELFVI